MTGLTRADWGLVAIAAVSAALFTAAICAANVRIRRLAARVGELERQGHYDGDLMSGAGDVRFGDITARGDAARADWTVPGQRRPGETPAPCLAHGRRGCADCTQILPRPRTWD